jgi:hypothetical protein
VIGGSRPAEHPARDDAGPPPSPADLPLPPPRPCGACEVTAFGHEARGEARSTCRRPAPGQVSTRTWRPPGATCATSADPDQRGPMFHDVPPEVVAEAFARPFVQTDRVLAEVRPDAWPGVPTRVLAAGRIASSR